MNRIDIHNKLHYYFGLLIAFTLPFGKLTSIFIGVLLINWIIEGGLKEKLKKIYNSKYVWIFISLYLIHVLGLFYTTNMDAAWFDLEVKLSLLILPILIAGKPYDRDNLPHFFIALIVGLVYSSLYLLSRSLSLYFINGENTFFYQNFTVFVHPSYLSMYINFIICWLLIKLIKRDKYQIIFSKTITISLLVFFSVIVFLLSSKSGLLTFLLIIIGLIIYSIFFKKNYGVALGGIAIMVSSFFIINSFVPSLKYRVNNFMDALTTQSEETTINSTAIRLLIWQSSNQIIKENFLIGVGTGDVKDALKQEYKKRGIENALKQNFNAHNQFYQVFIALGIIGFLVLIVCLFYPMFRAFKSKEYLYVFFLIIIVVNFLSESMLDRQAGVLFYSFFNSILCFGYLNNPKST